MTPFSACDVDFYTTNISSLRIKIRCKLYTILQLRVFIKVGFYELKKKVFFLNKPFKNLVSLDLDYFKLKIKTLKKRNIFE